MHWLPESKMHHKWRLTMRQKIKPQKIDANVSLRSLSNVKIHKDFTSAGGPLWFCWQVGGFSWKCYNMAILHGIKMP